MDCVCPGGIEPLGNGAAVSTGDAAAARAVLGTSVAATTTAAAAPARAWGDGFSVGCAEGGLGTSAGDGARAAVGARGLGSAELNSVAAPEGVAAGGGSEAAGRAVRGGSSVAIVTGAGMRAGGTGRPGVLVTSATGGSFAVVLRCMNTATSAPIPKPAITTPKPMAIVGSHPPPPAPEPEASGSRRRRGGVDIAARVQRIRQEASLGGANRRRMIRVSVPIDLNAVVSNASAAFALATPLRLADIVATAVVVSLGRRAPQDKRERAVRRTLDGLRAGEFVVEIDGRVYSDAHEVVVCAGVIALRFFARRSYRHAA